MKPVCRPPSNIVPCKNVHLMYLCDRMRPDEIEQYLALTGAKQYDAEAAARGFIGTPGHKFTVLGPDGFPAASGGYEEILPGIWQSWMVGSMEGWGANWRSLTKGCRWLMDGLFELGARRLQTYALASRTRALEWYERGLLMQYEGTMRGFGTNGEDVVLYSRVKEA